MTDETTRAYSAVADRYIDLFGAVEQVDSRDLAFIAEHLGGARGTVLDAGCGPGHLSAHLASLGVDTLGIDPVPEFIAHATRAHPAPTFRIGSLDDLDDLGDLGDLGVPDGSLGGVLAWYSLIHCTPDELDRALRTFGRALAPGGVIVVGAFDGERRERFDHKVTPALTWPADDLADRLSRAGLDEIARDRRPASPEHRAHVALAARKVRGGAAARRNPHR